MNLNEVRKMFEQAVWGKRSHGKQTVRDINEIARVTTFTSHYSEAGGIKITDQSITRKK